MLNSILATVSDHRKDEHSSDDSDEDSNHNDYNRRQL